MNAPTLPDSAIQAMTLCEIEAHLHRIWPEAPDNVTSDWGAAGPIVSELSQQNRLMLECTESKVKAGCIDAKGYYHVFVDAHPLGAIMRGALAVKQ